MAQYVMNMDQPLQPNKLTIASATVLSAKTRVDCMEAMRQCDKSLRDAMLMEFSQYANLEGGKIFKDAWEKTVIGMLQTYQLNKDDTQWARLNALALAIDDHETMDPAFKKELLRQLLPDALFE